MFGPDEVALPVALARATLAQAGSTDRRGGRNRGGVDVGVAYFGRACSEVIVGSRRGRSRLVERLEPRQIGVDAAEGVGGCNGQVVERGGLAERPNVGVCKWGIEVEGILGDDEG